MGKYWADALSFLDGGVEIPLEDSGRNRQTKLLDSLSFGERQLYALLSSTVKWETNRNHHIEFRGEGN